MKEYIKLEVKLYKKYGFIGGCIVQFLKGEDGEFVGTMQRLCDKIGIFDIRQIKYAVKELEEKNVISKEKSSACYYDFILLEEDEEDKKKKGIPPSVRELLKKIEEDRAKKAQKDLGSK